MKRGVSVTKTTVGMLRLTDIDDANIRCAIKGVCPRTCPFLAKEGGCLEEKFIEALRDYKRSKGRDALQTKIYVTRREEGRTGA